MSSGFCVTKYTPTPLERIRRTTCSIFSTSAFGASSNSRCASSKKNTSFGLSGSPTSGSCSNSSDEQPQQEGRVELGRVHQLVGGEDVDHALAVRHACMRSAMSSIGSPKNCAAPWLSSCSRPRWMAPIEDVLTLPYCGRELRRVVAHVLQHGAQVLEVEQQQAVVVGDLEHQAEHAVLRFVQAEHAAEQQRAHVGHRGAHRVPALAVDVPERRPGSRRTRASMPQRLQSLGHLGVRRRPAWRCRRGRPSRRP